MGPKILDPMCSLPSHRPVFGVLFAPLEPALAAASHRGRAPVLPDRDWFHLHLLRVLESTPSGRGFLQEHGARFDSNPALTTYFKSLKSERRAALLKEVGDHVIDNAQVPSRLRDLPELAHDRCFAADRHWHRAAAHDPAPDLQKAAAGHFYALDLGTHLLRHMAVAAEPHEHDRSVLKRLQPVGLRHGVPKRVRVLNIYDRAGIDFAYWARARQQCAVYILSRVREGMVFDDLREREWQREESRNAGVCSDRSVMSREGIPMRVIHYTDATTGKEYQFLTNVPDVPPGVLGEPYRRRWDIEKVFDQIKNKLDEKQAWASSLEAKRMQGRLVALAHNLLSIYRHRICREGGVEDLTEQNRQAGRIHELARVAREAGRAVSSLLLAPREATQHSVKFIRWLPPLPAISAHRSSRPASPHHPIALLMNPSSEHCCTRPEPDRTPDSARHLEVSTLVYGPLGTKPEG